MSSILVCGAGHQGLSMAAHLALSGEHVFLWNRTESNIKNIIDTQIIHCEGVVEGDAVIDKASSSIEELISDVIMITTPSVAHPCIAGLIAPYIQPETVIVLNPGRTFGAVEFSEELKKKGVKKLPHIAETQTIVYTCRKVNNDRAKILALKEEVEIAAIKNSDIEFIMSKMPTCLKHHFKVVDSIGYTSFGNVGMILHCAPVMMNIGWIESPKVDFKYYYDGISLSVAYYLEKMDAERCAVAAAAGYKVESVIEWLKRTYSVGGNNMYDCIRNNKIYKEIDAPKSLNTRYVFEDIPNGLVPIEALGKEIGIETPNITTIIDIASSVMNTDFRKTGRSFNHYILKDYF